MSPKNSGVPVSAHTTPTSPTSEPCTKACSSAKVLLPFPDGCLVASLLRRVKRFSVELAVEPAKDTGTIWAHSNNSGSMLGLTRPGTPALLSPAWSAKRKLPYTLECVWLGGQDVPQRAQATSACAAGSARPQGFWVGVNTSVPNKMLEAAFLAGRLPFARGYTKLVREVKRGQSRIDGLLTGPDMPPLWVECKNVTLVEDDAATFPDAPSLRAQKHLRELMDIVASGQRGALFCLVQRPDGHCFAPADFIDPAYAALFYQALHAGVEIYAFRARVSMAGVDLGAPLPVRPADSPVPNK